MPGEDVIAASLPAAHPPQHQHRHPDLLRKVRTLVYEVDRRAGAVLVARRADRLRVSEAAQVLVPRRRLDAPVDPSSLRRSDADISPATPTRGQRQSSTPPSTAKTQIIQFDITVSVTPAVLKTTVAALALPPFPFESEKSVQTPALNPHSLTPPPVRTPPRFPPSRLFGRLPPCIPSRLRLAGIRKPLTTADG